MNGGRQTNPADRDLGAAELVELAVVARQAGVKIVHVRRYLEFGLFEPHSATESPRLDPGNAPRIARAERLRRDLGLNYAGAVLVCKLLDRISQLETRLSPNGTAVRPAAVAAAPVRFPTSPGPSRGAAGRGGLASGAVPFLCPPPGVAGDA